MSDTLFWGALLMLGATGVAALATGRWRLEAVVDASDARLGRWMIGVVAIAGAVAAAVLEPAPMLAVPAIALGISGVWIVGTAFRIARKARTAGQIARAITASDRTARGRERARSRPIDSPDGEQDHGAAWHP